MTRRRNHRKQERAVNGKCHSQRIYRNLIAFVAGLGLLVPMSRVFAQCNPGDPPLPPPPSGGVALRYSLNGQTIEAEPNGSFVISNVAVPDVQAPFQVGDDYLRIIGVLPTNQGTQYGCPADDWTLYLYSQSAFRMTADPQTGRFKYVLEPNQVQIRCDPPPLPESILLETVGGQPVVVTGTTRQLKVTATLTHGDPDDVTRPSKWTTYRISNSRIAVVCQTDLPPDQYPPECQSVSLPPGTVHVLGLAAGTAFITATNGGATSVLKITISNPENLIYTSVEGFVQHPDGLPVMGAVVSVKDYGGLAISGSDGFFRIGTLDDPLNRFQLPKTTTETGIVVEAVLQSEAMTELGISPTLTPIPSGITDAGIIVIELFCGTPWSAAFGPTTLEGGAVQAFAVFDNDGAGPEAPRLFAGGKFSKAGGTVAGLVAQWDGMAWHPVGGGFTPGPNGSLGEVKRLAVLDLNDGNGPMLYAAGSFVEAENTTSTIALARWNGTNWSGVGGGVGESHAIASALVAFNNELYVGGNFITAGLYDAQNGCLPQNGCVTAKRVAKWNPITNTWSQVGAGFDNGEVLALAVFQSELYAGGDFTLTNGQFVNHVVKWNGSQWVQVGGGLSASAGNGRVTSLTVFDDGTGPALYAGGDFFGATGDYVAKWNGTSWTPVGPGLSSGEVLALAGVIDGTNRYLYASGQFTSIGGGGGSAKYIARWNGSTWSALGTGLESAGQALAVFDRGSGPAIHVGGEFCISCGGFTASGNEGDGQGARSADRLSRMRLARRNKDQRGGVSSFAGFVAAWKPNEWSVLGNGLSDEVHAATDGVHSLIVHDDGTGPALIAGGNFKAPRGPDKTNLPPFPTNGIAKFDGTRWRSLRTGMTITSGSPPPPADIRALVTFDEDGAGSSPPRLFAGGDFNLAGGVSANNVARWDGSVWSAVGNIGGVVNALAVFDEDGAGANPPRLFAGGDFASRIARWNGSTWTALGSGINNGSVTSLAVYDNQLYVGGTFADAGGIAAADFLARWNGTTWSAVQSGGSGVNGSVYALYVFDRDGAGPTPPELYVGGAFTTAGGITVNRIARWDGGTWSQVGPASDPGFGPTGKRVTSLFGFDNGQGPMLYAGGDFTQSGNGTLTLKRLAKWNPVQNQWLAVGSNSFGNGVDGEGTVSVSALAAFDDGVTGLSLYAGGSFDSAGGQFDQGNSVCVPNTGCVPAANIAKLGCR
jgi:hypothetical protein